MLAELKFLPRELFTNTVYIPLFIEPVVGSGERLCVGAAMQFGDRQELVILPGIKRLSRIYGDAAKSLEFAVSLVEKP